MEKVYFRRAFTIGILLCSLGIGIYIGNNPGISNKIKMPLALASIVTGFGLLTTYGDVKISD